MGVFRIGRGAFGRGGLLGSLLGGKEISTRVSRTLIGGIATSLRNSENSKQLGAALSGTVTNSLKRNFKLWGYGAEIEGQYFSKEQLDNLKNDAKNYQNEINNINNQLKTAEKGRENIKNASAGEEAKETALRQNQEKIDKLNEQKLQATEKFVQKEIKYIC